MILAIPYKLVERVFYKILAINCFIIISIMSSTDASNGFIVQAPKNRGEGDKGDVSKTLHIDDLILLETKSFLHERCDPGGS